MWGCYELMGFEQLGTPFSGVPQRLLSRSVGGRGPVAG